MDKDILSRLEKDKYSNWGEREPLVFADNQKHLKAISKVSSKDLSPPLKSAIFLNELTNCQGLEFIAFSNTKINKPVCLPNEVVLFPCFFSSLEGKNMKDPREKATLRMMQTGRFVYDGWLPLKSMIRDNIVKRLEELRQALSLFAIVSGSKFTWEPKYKILEQNNATHYYSDEQIDTLVSLSGAFTNLTQADRNVLYRSIGWISQSIRLDDEKARFLFCVLAIESLCTYIEQDADEDSLFEELRGEKLSKAERKTLRNECIKSKLADTIEDNPTKAVSDAYFECITGIKKRLKDHLERLFGKDDVDVKKFFEGAEEIPSLYDMRHTIAHGTANAIGEGDILRITQSIYTIESMAKRYVWTVINRSLNVFNKSSRMKASIGIDIKDMIIPRREMYCGPVDIGILYAK